MKVGWKERWSGEALGNKMMIEVFYVIRVRVDHGGRAWG
jgi:hypothetical protein